MVNRDDEARDDLLCMIGVALVTAVVMGWCILA